MKLLNGICVTLVIAAGTYLIGMNILHPWQGLRFTASSDLELGIAVFLALVATAACLWRLLRGSSSSAELRRFGAALDGTDDLS